MTAVDAPHAALVCLGGPLRVVAVAVEDHLPARVRDVRTTRMMLRLRECDVKTTRISCGNL